MAAKGKLQTQKVVSADRVTAYIRSRFNPIRSLTPELLASHLDSFRNGYLKQAALLWEDMEMRDDTLTSVAPKRKKAVSRHGWDILVVETEDKAEAKTAERHKEALAYFYNNITVTNALDENEKGEVGLLCRQMMDAVSKRYAVHEIVWQPSPQGLTAELRFVPLWFFENTTGRLRYLASEASLTGQAMDDASWLVTVADGLMYACSIAYMYKNLSLKDWIIYNERHGMPGIHAKTSAAKGSAEWTDLSDAVENFASDWSILTSEGATIDKLDLSAQGQLPYPPLVDRMSRAMAAIWRGADLSTMSSGSGVGASLQGDEMSLLEQDDAALISETLSRQIDRRIIEYAFGPGVKPLAYFRLKTPKKADLYPEIALDKFLLDSGAPLSAKDTLERYGRSVPRGQEDVLLTPNPQGQVPPPGQPGASPAPGALANRSAPPSRRRPLHALRNSESSPSAKSADNSALLSSGLSAVAQAVADDLQPVRSRLETILQVEDPELRNAALRKLQSDLPDLLKKINANPAGAKALEDTLSAAMLNGLTSDSAIGDQPISNAFDPSQPRDENGMWTEEGGGGGKVTTHEEADRRGRAISAWAMKHGETGAKELAHIERAVFKGSSLKEAVKKAYARRERMRKYAFGEDLYQQMKAEGKIKEGPPLDGGAA